MDKINVRAAYPKLVNTIIEGMENVKAHDISVLNLQALENSVCDFFVICSGTSNTQVKAICDRVEKEVRESLNEKPWHIEGKESADWVLMDYVSVVVHIFKPQSREFYDLESLWGDAEVVVLEENH
jgi:ribosome-associated protein